MRRMILAIALALPCLANANTEFKKWKSSFTKRAVKTGLPKKFVTDLLNSVKVSQKIISKDRNQVLFSKKKDYPKFINGWLGHRSKRVQTGLKQFRKYRTLLSILEKRYKVDKEIIIAIWGTETLYGEITGKYDLIQSLATLSYEGRRRNFFEKELIAAMKLIYHKHATRSTLKGSWAGATGQCQFMPSNHSIYAQDYDKDGRKDIWNNIGDVFASIANYLKKVGWQKGKPLGLLAKNTKNIDDFGKKLFAKNDFDKFGIRYLNGSKIRDSQWFAKRIHTIPLQNSPVVIEGPNYKVLKRWNSSSLFVAMNIILVEKFKQR